MKTAKNAVKLSRLDHARAIYLKSPCNRHRIVPPCSSCFPSKSIETLPLLRPISETPSWTLVISNFASWMLDPFWMRSLRRRTFDKKDKETLKLTRKWILPWTKKSDSQNKFFFQKKVGVSEVHRIWCWLCMWLCKFGSKHWLIVFGGLVFKTTSNQLVASSQSGFLTIPEKVQKRGLGFMTLISGWNF